MADGSRWQHAHHILVRHYLQNMICTIVLGVFHVTREDGLVRIFPRFDDVVTIIIIITTTSVEVIDRLLLHLVSIIDGHQGVCQFGDIRIDIFGICRSIVILLEVSTEE